MAWNDPKPVLDGFGNVVTDGFGNPVMNRPGQVVPDDDRPSQPATQVLLQTHKDRTKQLLQQQQTQAYKYKTNMLSL